MATRARSIRVAVALVNVLCALVSIGVGFLLLRDREQQRVHAAPAFRPFVVPAADEPSCAPLILRGKPGRGAPTALRGMSAYEDMAVLTDAPTEFAHAWRVVLASFGGDPRGRSCIIERRGGWDQQTLVPGERVGKYLLMELEPIEGAPRSVRLTFRELRRGEEVVVVLQADH